MREDFLPAKSVDGVMLLGHVARYPEVAAAHWFASTGTATALGGGDRRDAHEARGCGITDHPT